MIQFQPLVVETPDFPSQLMIDTHLPVLCYAKRRIRQVREHGVQTGRALAGGDSSEHARFQPASSLRRHACCHGVIHTSVLGSPSSFLQFS